MVSAKPKCIILMNDHLTPRPAPSSDVVIECAGQEASEMIERCEWVRIKEIYKEEIKAVKDLTLTKL